MPGFGKIKVIGGPPYRDVYFKGIYDSEATQLDANGESKTIITAELGVHTLVTITDTDKYRIDYEGDGRILEDGQCIVIELVRRGRRKGDNESGAGG